MLQLLLVNFFFLFHPFYVSVTEIEQNQKTKSVQVSVRIFYDDFEKALNSQYKSGINIIKPVDRKKVDAVIESYLKSHLKIKANGKPLALNYVGYEIEKDAAWCYLESPQMSPVSSLDIENNILFEAHSSQSNMIHAIVNGQRKSTKLDNPESEASIRF